MLRKLCNSNSFSSLFGIKTNRLHSGVPINTTEIGICDIIGNLFSRYAAGLVHKEPALCY